ncbi:folliculin [Eurosta solidaginis]|uniref:folliculin n=1 Tax=Eurosta solidaginis TaxID=178769 RepID=UPI0035312BA1
MNAVIALCHFCEAHGPSAIFCTQTLRDTKIEELQLDNQEIDNKMCSACLSLGTKNAIYSKDTESGATFLSTQTASLADVQVLIKQAAVRSLSCEVSSNKDGCFVFFGDSTRGHVLSHTFQVSDMQARGFYQLFSIIVLMKDKYFLLNTKPFLAEHLRKISAEIQTSAKKIYDNCKDVPRQRRMSGPEVIVQTPRSLVELTGEENIYAYLHSHFSWTLLAGSRYLTEHVTFGNLPWLPPQSSDRPPQQRLTYNITLPMLQKYEETINDPQREEFYSLRHVKEVVRHEFSTAVYCALTGIKIIVRDSSDSTLNFMLCLKKLLPEPMHNLLRIDAQHQHSISSDYKIISVSNEIAVPIASTSVYRVDFLDSSVDGNKVRVKWRGELPTKCPDLMVKLLKAVDEPRFTPLVLNKQTKVLIEEWKNKIICLNRAKTSNGQAKLRKVLGLQAQDQPLINYWSAHLQ